MAKLRMRYKIKRHGDGRFSVWRLEDFGEGRAWVDTGKRYSAKEAGHINESEGKKNASEFPERTH